MKRKLFTAMMLTGFLGSQAASFAVVDANTLPSLNNAINGAVSQNGNTLNAQVGVGSGQTAGAVAQFDWNHFNVGSNGTVNWAFTNNHQTALNRVIGNNMSEIYGKLTQSCAGAGCTSFSGTGKVVLINPNGILFGDGSQVNLNSFTASTFDAVGAKNIKDLAGADYTTYANSLNSTFGPNVKINFTGTADKIGSLIKLDNSKFDVDKSVVILSKDVEIGNGSTIDTNLAYNYGSPSYHQNFSNVKIATGNGAVVQYQKNGYVNNESDMTKSNFGFSANEGLDNVDYDLKIGSATGEKTNITSGNIFIKNNGKTYGADGSNIDIQNTNLSGVKLVNSQLGEVNVVGNNYIDIKNSKIETYNSHETNNQANKNTYAKKGGTVLVNGEMGVNLNNVTIQTANSTATEGAGDVVLKSNSGNIGVNKSTINSQGNVDVAARVNANVTNSSIYASNTRGLDAKDINITGQNEVNVGNTNLAATGDVTLKSDKKVNVYKGGGVNSIVYAGGNLNLHGADTTVTDSNLSYNKISLYEEGKVNNVTIKDNSTLEDRSATNGEGLVLNANGKLTVDANKLQKRNITFDITPTTLTEVGKSTLNAGATIANQDKVTLTSAGDLSFVNGSQVTSAGDINGTSTAGGINILGASSLTSDSNVNLTSNNTLVDGTNFDTTSSITAKNVTIKTTGADSDIISNLDGGKINYTERLKLDAARDVKLSSTVGMNLAKLDLVAGNSTNLMANSDINLSDVTMKAPNNNVTSANGSVNLDKLVLNSATTLPENTVTRINAGTNVVTNADSAIEANNTKVIINAGNNINVKTTGVQNANAGIEAKGNNITIDAKDDVLAISRIEANRLNLDANDKFIAAKTTLTANDVAGLENPATGTNPATPVGDATGRAYIQVNEYNGFNLDNSPSSLDAQGNYIGIYTASYQPGDFVDQDGNPTSGYTKHFVNLQGPAGDEKFLLVYDKQNLVCPPGDDVPTDDSSSTPVIAEVESVSNSDLSNVRLPIQAATAGNEAINNNLTDLSTSIVAAAAGISLDEEEEE